MKAQPKKFGLNDRFFGQFTAIYALITAGILLWCLALIPSPILFERSRLISAGVRYFFSFVCHQNPDRSFQVMGHSMTVCARCTGIYLGTLIGVLSFPFVIGMLNDNFPWKKWLVIALSMNLIESLLSALNWFTNLYFRAGTGIALGFWTALCVMYGIFHHVQTQQSRWET